MTSVRGHKAEDGSSLEPSESSAVLSTLEFSPVWTSDLGTVKTINLVGFNP